MSEQMKHFLCCGRVFRDAHALEQHVRDSPNHKVPGVAGDAKSCSSTQPLGSTGYSDSSIPRSAGAGCPCGGMVAGANGLEAWGHGELCGPTASHNPMVKSLAPMLEPDDGLRCWPVTFVKEGQAKEKKKKGTGKGKGKGNGSASHRSYGVYSGSGQWYSDVGDDHSLCDKDCGWCGHCAEGVLY
ncbi:uncharacterized protein VB005_00423 [Metarhizium brunneum]